MTVFYSSLFKRDLKLVKKRGYDINLLMDIVETLADGKPLEPKHKDHQLKGKYVNFRECHVENDWLLVYRIHNDKLVLALHRTGTHSDLFNK